jgi:hypothetical protein
MNYEWLWNEKFKCLEERNIDDINHWNSETLKSATPFTIYSLNNTIPSAESLGIGSAKRQLPISRAFDDHALMTVCFKTSHHTIYCSYTTSIKERVLFCLWERIPSIGIQHTLPLEIFDENVLRMNMDIDVFYETSYNEERTIIRSKCIYSMSSFYRTHIDEGSIIWSKVKIIFTPMIEEFCGVAESIFQQREHNEFKNELLKLKSLWTMKFENAIQEEIPVLSSSDIRVAIWLFVSGCPGIITSAEQLSNMISSIIQSFDEDIINSVDFISKMERNGFGRPFSRLVAMHLSCLWYGEDFFSVMCGLSTPLNLNSFLRSSDDNQAEMVSYLKDNGGDISSSSPSQCLLAVQGLPDNRPLGTSVFTPSAKQWYPIDFARHIYQHIKLLLEKNCDHVVYGHVSSEQSVIKMCRTKDKQDPNIGISLHATHLNSATCGRGMYFFRISSCGNFEDLCRGGGSPDDSITVEFQSFLYALTRAFQNSDIHYLSPAVLLFEVKRDILSNFKDATKNVLPLLDEKCICPCRYEVDLSKKDPFQIVSDVSPTARDMALVLKHIVRRMKFNYENERINSIAIRLGLINFSEVLGYISYVSDGSHLSEFKWDMKNMLKSCEVQYNDHYHALKVDNVLREFKLTENIQHWRRQPLGFTYLGNFRFGEQITISKKDELPSHWSCDHELCNPLEWVITSIDVLENLVLSEENNVSVVFIDSNVEHSSRSSVSESDLLYFGIQENLGFDKEDIEENSTHSYYSLLRHCTFKSRSSVETCRLI